ncbi:RAMP superfamily CRISPR-associated protein [Breoghania sp.]|uniref:RAMP superfamily CRISPR-associated protein n=1 Tax=Breoghania sp. TaxID=2065378 RepID=UPI003749EF38
MLYEINATVRIRSPLHVGSGSWRHVAAVKGKNGSSSGGNTAPDVASIQRDAAGLPYVPGATWKGLFRRLGESLFNAPGSTASSAEVERLFGTISSRDEGQMGLAIFRGSSMSKPGDASQMPYADKDDVGYGPSLLGKGVFVSARTRIDPATGTAADAKLYFQEMVAAGAEFPLTIILDFRNNDGRASQVLEDMVHILSQLVSGAPAIGKGTKNAFGELSIVPKSVKLTKRTLGQNLKINEDDVTYVWTNRTERKPPEPVWQETFRMVCEGPFIVLDSSRTSKEKQSPDDRKPQLQAQRVSKNLPLLLGSGISGALRAQTCWLEALKQHRKGTDQLVDDPDHVVRSSDDIGDLTPVQRLFGVTGFKGLLSLEAIEVAQATPWDVTSVKLDRFSGAPIDNALFTSATFVGTRLSFRLSMAARPGLTPNADDIALAKDLSEQIKTEGLMLGHGTNKGFGWFEQQGD